jgi:hypothetical protein
MPSGLTPYNPDLGVYLIGDIWRLSNGVREVACRVSTHPFGWELRVESKDELARSQVCRSQKEVFDTADAWKAEAEAKGWDDLG